MLFFSKRRLSLLLSLVCFSLMAFAQSMSDAQVLQYVKDGMQQGKDQRQLATELARRGVTREQAERVKKLYESENQTTESTIGTVKAEDRLREQTKEDNTTVFEQQPEELTSDQVFGRNIFNTRNLTFEPSVNLATPPTTGWARAMR